MRNYFRKYWLQITIAAVALIAVVVGASLYQRQQVAKNSTENRLTNPARQDQPQQDTFYYDQLSDKEKGAYEVLKNALEEFQGGAIKFPEPLTGVEYIRVTESLEYGPGDYFYGIINIPMTAQGQSVTGTGKSILDVTDDTIEQCIVFLSCAANVDEQGKFDDEGYVTNLENLRDDLEVSDQEKQELILQEKEQIQAALDQVIAEIPKEYGVKETTDYLLAWVKENIQLDQETIQGNSAVQNMSDLFEKLYKRYYPACILEKKAMTAGYAKLFSSLCNKAGIPSHVVWGTWRDGEGYILTCVEIDGEKIYVDVSGEQAKDLWNLRYLTRGETKGVMNFAEYFEYEQ